MCDVLGRVLSHTGAGTGALSRRGFLRAAGATATAGGLLGGTATATGATERPVGAADARGHRTRLVLLGTAGGTTILRGQERFGTSTAVVYDDRVYVVDLGLGADLRLAAAGLGGEALNGAFSRVRGILFTHLHSDHVAAWPAVYLLATMNNADSQETIRVFGPGDRTTLPRVFPPGRPAPPVVSPEAPTPGVSAMTAQLRGAFATDLNDRARDSGFRLPDTVFDVNDLDVTPYWEVDPEGVPPRLERPIPVWEDGEVRITATLVDHRPTAPAFAYRFDTPDGAVVVSGDTAVSDNLIDLVRGADYLVHEVIDPVFVERLAATVPPELQEPLREHLLAAHTTIEQVGRDVAEPAEVRNLVLTHLVPTVNDPRRWQEAKAGFSGRLIVGEDLLQLGVAS